MRLYFLPLWLIVIATTCTTAHASSGDRSDVFQRCLDICTRQSCTASDNDGRRGRSSDTTSSNSNTPNPGSPLPLALRLTRWTCADDCKYGCMHTVTDLALESGVRMEQFYGKWPFWRWAGMQEPASVAFSVANLLMHVLGLDWLRRGVHPAHPMRPFYLTWAYLSVNAWLWSAVFHTRGAYILFTPRPPSPSFVRSHLCFIYTVFPFSTWAFPFPSAFHLMHKKRVFDLLIRAAPCWALRASIQTRH